MSFAVGPIGGAPPLGAGAVQGVQKSGGASFGQIMSTALGEVQNTQKTAESTALKAVTGDMTDIHNATIAATRAQVTLELVATVRNKGVEAFNDIMRMQA